MKVPYNGKEIEAEEVDFLTRKEDFNEYQLSDGSVLRLKQVVTRILRLKDEKSADGNPIYNISSQPVFFITRGK